MYQPRLERFCCPILVGGEKRAKTGTLSREIHTCANREPSILRMYSYSIKLMKPTWVEDHTSRLYPCIVWSQDYCCFDNSKLHLAREELQVDVRLDGCCHCWPCSCRTFACPLWDHFTFDYDTISSCTSWCLLHRQSTKFKGSSGPMMGKWILGSFGNAWWCCLIYRGVLFL